MPNKKRKPSIVVIGGGTGTFVVLMGLKEHDVELTSIVTMSDDGGSTGQLRDDYGVLPPGDVRRSLVALSESNELLRQLFEYRFENGGVKGHSFGNLVLTALQNITGDFDTGLKVASKVLRIRGTVLPVTLDDTRLIAELEDGSVIRGEQNIDIPKHNSKLHIKKIWLDPPAKANPLCIKAIKNADLIVLAPGDLYTSLVPNLLVKGISDAIKVSKAKKVYVANLMTKVGETHDFKLSDLLDSLKKYLGCTPQYILYNTEKPSASRLKKYAAEGSEIIENNVQEGNGIRVIATPLLRKKGLIRHSPKRLAEAILKCFD